MTETVGVDGVGDIEALACLAKDLIVVDGLGLFSGGGDQQPTALTWASTVELSDQL